MKKRLYFFTDGYPFGFGEKPFVGPEIERFSNFFDITVFSPADDGLVAAASASALPEGVKLVRLGPGSRLKRGLIALGMPFNRRGFEEIKRIMASGERRFARVVAAAKLYANAEVRRRSLRSAGWFDGCGGKESALYYSYWMSTCTMALTLEKARGTEFTLVSRAHGYDLYNEQSPTGWQSFQIAMRDASDKIIFASDEARNYYDSTFGGDPRTHVTRRIGSAGPGVDAPRVRQQAGHLHIVSCSNVIPRKRVRLIEQALEAIGPGLVSWTHIGTGEELESVMRDAEAAGLDARFLGRLSSEEVYDFYRRGGADVFVTTTRREGGCPVSIQEALSYGLPVIGTAVGGIPEEIDGNGALLDPNPGVEQFVAALRCMLEADDGEYERMSARSLELWRERFDRERCLEELQGELESTYAETANAEAEGRRSAGAGEELEVR